MKGSSSASRCSVESRGGDGIRGTEKCGGFGWADQEPERVFLLTTVGRYRLATRLDAPRADSSRATRRGQSTTRVERAGVPGGIPRQDSGFREREVPAPLPTGERVPTKRNDP